MQIQNNVLRHYLRNCYFIDGTAYAGKSTMCKMLAERFDLIHCGENYGADGFMQIAEPQTQPNLTYMRLLTDWQQFLNRTPEEYSAWIDGNSRELADFEVAELISISAERKVIVDTNIPLEILREISDYNRVAIMLAPQSISIDNFFDRDDPEKQFLLGEIQKSADPKATMANFKACLTRLNSQETYDAYLNSGFFTIVREDLETDRREETLAKLAAHFGFASDTLVLK